MEDKDTQYINGDADDFTIFLFSEKPKDKNTIKLELTPSENPIHIGLHIFQELLMIFTSGMKYLFSEEDILQGKTSVLVPLLLQMRKAYGHHLNKKKKQ